MNLQLFGPSAKLHHIGLAVNQIDSQYLDQEEITEDPIQRVKVGFVSIADASIELIQPLNDQSPIHNSLKKGNKFVHLCFEVDDIHESLSCAESHQFKVIQQPVPAAAFANRKIAWVYHREWGLFELLERDRTI
ncbi:hypothetical protein GXP70_28030 [Paenibacillus lycopersici]|uniref:Methylmalonyl-CoA epimerase n=1 Tax=Paenibacillus lycopersici TaxID=2704462 RepID=A0A6C0G4A6_9BACL|nr:VOC family protein [Paenibacillus lycopersici]QHT63422.1 hypothetical protein GXP70_28030 [Paenibacillus lycopersici]